ncbi:MAG: cysteine desulfurase [Comamonadaceae bacterium]|nr:cysteine desulfurase [Comamonadaceae bacterium]
MKDDKIYLFAGTKDSLVPQEVMDAVRLYYTNLGVNPANIKYVKDVPAGHAMVTVSYGNDCSVLASPYINQCGSKEI